MAMADAVFAGTVVSAQYHPFTPDGGHYVSMQFKVHTVWKGPLNETMFVKTGATTCGMRGVDSLLYGVPEGVDFVPEYIVYASDWWGDGLWTGLCDRTYYAKYAQQDFAELGAGRKPTPGSVAPLPPPLSHATPASAPRGNGCSIPSKGSHNPADVAALGLLAGIPALGVLRRRRGN